MTEVMKLALDTLYGRRIEPKGSCFRLNEAGLELSKSDVEALDSIEGIIESIVAPAACRLSEFVGLNYLIGAYLVIGVREKSDRVFEFMTKQPLELLREAVNCCSTFFLKTSHGFNFGVAPNNSVLRFLSDLESSNDSDMAMQARKVREELEKYKAIADEVTGLESEKSPAKREVKIKKQKEPR